MPRHSRTKSKTKIYHVVARGINRQDIYEDTQDYECFLSIIQKLISEKKCELYAWCLMSNHYHLLIKEKKEALNSVMKSLGTRYAMYFNKKYNRIGHLFQDRYGSRPVKDTAQLLAVARYIHMNPVKAGIVKSPEKYAYSSYKEYLSTGKSVRTRRHINSIANTSLILEIMDLTQLIKYTKEYSNEQFLDFAPNRYNRLTDEESKAIMKKYSNCSNASEFQMLKKPERNAALREMIDAGVMLRQAARITGYSTNVIYGALKG